MAERAIITTTMPQSASSTEPSPLPSKVRIPIRIKITLPFLILAIVLALGTVYIVTQVVLDTVEERFTNQLVEGGRLASEWMVREENRMLKTLRLLANTEGIPKAFGDGDVEKLRNLSYGIAVNNGEEAVDFLDQNGNILLSLRHSPESNPEDYEFSSGGENIFADLEFVQNVLQEESDPMGDKYAGLVPLDSDSYFYIAGPVTDESGKRVGAVLVGKSLDTLARQIRNETLTQVTLYDQDGQPLASTFSTPEVLEPADAQAILAGQSDESLRRDLQRSRGLNLNNMDYAEILSSWVARGGDELGVTGISLVKTFLVKTSRFTRAKISLLVAFTLMCIVLLGINLAHYITRPINRLLAASTEAAQGRLDVRVQVSSQDEIAVLADSFNRMVANLDHSRTDLLNTYDHTLAGWSRALEMRDMETQGHTVRVAEITEQLAARMGVPESELVQIHRGVLLHDIGKMAIPDSILLKPGPLNDEEWNLMRRHPEFAYEMLYPIEFLRPALNIPYCHHEHWDGKGYPRGLVGEEIPLAARIFAVVDVWDALTSARPYHPPFPPEEALEIICNGRGSHFDPRVVDAFLNFKDLIQNNGSS